MIPIRDRRPSRTFPYVTIALIVINALIFLYQLILKSEPSGFVIQTTSGFTEITKEQLLIYSYGVIPREITNFKDFPPTIPFPFWFPLLSSMFLHGGFFHLGGNMLYLWIFGDNIEDSLGHFRFILFYFGCGVIAAWAQIAISVNSSVPLIGASGAIAGVLGAYFLLFPQSRVLTLVFFFYFIRIVELPAVMLLGIWFLFQLLSGSTIASSTGGVAFFAHVGGFVAGALWVYLFKREDVALGGSRRRY